jgi:D-alanyl-D-alanine carboxypeptidase
MSESNVPAIRGRRILDPPPESERSSSFWIAATGALLVALFAALVLVSKAQAAPLSTANQEFVNSTVETAMKEERQPGVMISITGPEGEYTKAYGYANSSTKEALSLEDHFRIGSITKTFTATAILRQIEEGNLSYNNTLSEFVTGIKYGEEITVRDLLDMRSGVYEFESAPEFEIGFALNHKEAIGPQTEVEIIRNHEPEAKPDEITHYTESNYILLGLILEQVSGEPAEEAITKEVIEPLGLEHTSFPSTVTGYENPDTLPAPFAQGYEYNLFSKSLPLTLATEMNPEIPWTMGAIVSTIGDMSKYAKELGTGALLSSGTEEERLEFCPIPYTLEGPTEFGYGLGILSFGTWIGHDGSVPGYSSEVFYEPETGATIVGMENLQTTNLAIFSRIFEHIANHLYPGSMETPKYPEC